MRPRTPALAAALALVACTPGSSVDPPPELADPGRVDPAVAERAAEALERIRAAPEDADARYELALVYDAHALDDLAERAYEQTVALDPQRARAWYLLATERMDRGALGEALAASARAAELAPDYAPIRWRRALWLTEADRLGEARDDADAALAIDPDDPHAALVLARIELAAERPAAAIGVLETLLEREPDHAYARHLLGRALLASGAPDAVRRAEVELARAGEPAPRWLDAWTLEVEAHRVGYNAAMAAAMERIRAGRAREVVAELERMHAERPDDVTLQGMLAAAWNETAQEARAIEMLEAARARLPEHYRIELNLSLAYHRLGDGERALAHARRAVALHPRHALAHYQLGRVLLRANDPAGAVGALEEAVRLGREDLGTLLALASVQRGLDRLDDARRTLELATGEHPASARAWASLARVQAESGDLARAGQTLERAARVDAGDETVLEVAELLRALGGGG